MAEKPRSAGTAPTRSPAETDSDGPSAVVVRVLCVNGELSRAMIGYGRERSDAYANVLAEAHEFCRDFGGVEKLTEL